MKLTKDDVKAMYSHGNTRDRALLLVLAQSGFSEVDVSFFRIEELKGLYDNPETEHYFIEKPREKTNEIQATCFIRPDLFLLDEPIANIDEVTKLEVAKNLKQLLIKLKMPTIIVTHNRDDALFLAERLAIMIEGRIEQTGTVKDILASPKNALIKKILTPITQQ